MAHLISFSTGVILLAIVVALLAFIIMILTVPLLGKRTLTPVCFVVAFIFLIILIVSNTLFISLTETKIQLERFEQSPEYHLIQRGQELLEKYSEDLADIVSLFIGEDVTAETIANLKSQINKYLWIDVILCIVVFAIGVFTVNNIAKQNTNKRKGHSRNVRSVPSHDDF